MVSQRKKTKSKPYFTLKIIKDGEMIDRCRTHSKRRFFNYARTINWKIKHLKVYLKVYYGKQLDVWGKYSSFHNDGEYENKDDFWLALKAFCEED